MPGEEDVYKTRLATVITGVVVGSVVGLGIAILFWIVQ